MRVLLIVGWLFVGLGGVIFHYGPGQEMLDVDNAHPLLTKARYDVNEEDWAGAIENYDRVLSELPADKVTETRQVILEKAKAQMMAAKLPEARQSLQSLLDDVRADKEAAPEFKAEIQSTLANSQYYMTWLMRLEGLPEEEWMPEIEAARQHYTQLTMDADKLGDQQLAMRSAEDLESAIRLQRMDLSELQALPLPSQ